VTPQGTTIQRSSVIASSHIIIYAHMQRNQYYKPAPSAPKTGLGSGRLLMGGSLPGEEPEGTRSRDGGGEYLSVRDEKREGTAEARRQGQHNHTKKLT